MTRALPRSKRSCRSTRGLLLLLSLLTLLLGCGDEADDAEGGAGGGGGSGLERDVAPVVSGTWWRPGVDVTWSWQIQGDLNDAYDVDVYDVDLFDVSSVQIADLQAADRRVLCYFSAGSWEEWRADAAAFPVAARGQTLSGFPDERWLDIRRQDVFDAMAARLDLAVTKGCDGVEPDNVTGWSNATGFALSADDQLAFTRNLFNAAHDRGLAVALKNGLDQVAELVEYADLSVNEQCHEYAECDVLQPFLDAGKPILNAEYLAAYRIDPESVCGPALIADIRTLVLDTELDDSFRVACDTDFPSTTRLADVETYVTYYQQDPARIAELARLDLSIVQPVLTYDQIRSLQLRGKAAVYLSIGEIGLSNTYVYEGAVVLGQVIYDAHPEWFLERNPFFDSYFADTRETGWQQFIVDQAGLLLDEGYDGIFMDTVDTVDVYPETIPGMVALIALLRDTYPDIVIIQNRGMNVIPQTGADVDALMFEVFNSYFDSNELDYRATNVEQIGYPELVEKAVAYRLTGGVVLSQDFALAEPQYEDLICYARDRALRHLFVPSYADKFFQDGFFAHPGACPWPATPGYELVFEPPIANLSPGRTTTVDIRIEGRLGYTEPVTVGLGGGDAPPLDGTYTIFDGTFAPGETTQVVFQMDENARMWDGSLAIAASSAAGDQRYEIAVATVHETAVVANAGLSNIVGFDEPSGLTNPATPNRRSGGIVSQPYAVAIDVEGATWVVENVGDPEAAQPAGRVLRYARVDLSQPEAVFDTGLSYPTGMVIADDGRVWIANSGLDWTGTPRGGTGLATIAPGAGAVSAGFTIDTASYGYPRKITLDSLGRMWMTTSFGLVLMIVSPIDEIGGVAAPAVVIVAVGGDTDYMDVVYDVVTDSTGDVLISGRLSSTGQSRIIEVLRNTWATGGIVSPIDAADVRTEVTTGLYDPWDIDFAENGDLWVVNSTDAADDVQSRGSLVRFAADASGTTIETAPAQTIDLDSRFTLGLAVGQP